MPVRNDLPTRLLRLVFWALVACLALAPGYEAGARAQAVAEKAALKGHRGPVVCLIFSPDGKTLVSGDAGVERKGKRIPGEIRLWEMPSGKALATLEEPPGGLYALAFAPDGKTLAVGSNDEGLIAVWDVATRKRLRAIRAHEKGPVPVAFAPDGKLLVSAGSDETVKLWDTRTWALKKTLPERHSYPGVVAFSPDGKLLAAGPYNIRLWAMPGGTRSILLEGVTDAPARAASLAFSPDGKTLAACNDPEKILLWDTATGKLRASLPGCSRTVSALAVTPGGRTLASADWSGEVLLWDLATRKEVAALGSEYDSFLSVAFTADGKTLVTGGRDGNVRLWDVAQLRRRYEQVQAWTKAPPGVSAREAAEMRKRIAALAEVKSPDFGLSPTLQGHAFAPVAGSQRVSVMVLTDHQIKPSHAVLELVKLGPRAIPFLLEALDDKRPTKLVLDPQAITRFGFPKDGGPYTVKIGDVCYVALGQIVGEYNSVVTYIPSGNVMLSSPTEDPGIVRRLRMRWVSADPAKQLYEKLMKEYQTKPKFNGTSLDDWSDDSDLQIEAAMRLLYYFPRRSAPMIAERLSRLDVAAPGKDDDAWMKREVANGVRTVKFIKAVAWSKETAIQKALRGILERTTDADVLLAVLPTLPKDDTVRKRLQTLFEGTTDPQMLLAVLPLVKGIPEKQVRARLEEMLDRLPESEDWAFQNGYTLLVALGKRAGKEARPAFVRYLRNASLQRQRTMCHVLRETNGEWALEFLSPMLTDKRVGYMGSFASDPKDWFNKRLPIRLCDDAAKTIHQHIPELRFTMVGQYADLDRQIEVMRRQIAARKR
jgi:hypothetical protein